MLFWKPFCVDTGKLASFWKCFVSPFLSLARPTPLTASPDSLTCPQSWLVLLTWLEFVSIAVAACQFEKCPKTTAQWGLITLLQGCLRSKRGSELWVITSVELTDVFGCSIVTSVIQQKYTLIANARVLGFLHELCTLSSLVLGYLCFRAVFARSVKPLMLCTAVMRIHLAVDLWNFPLLKESWLQLWNTVEEVLMSV